MNLRQQLWVRDGDDFLELGHLLQVLAVPLAHLGVRVVLETADHVEDGVLGEHHLEKCVLVEQEDVLEDLKEVVQALNVLEVFTNVEQVQQLSDVALHL